MLALQKYVLPKLGQCRWISGTGPLRSDELFVHRDTSDNNSNTPFEFTQANMTRIKALIHCYPAGAQRSVVGAALDIVQRQIGWVPISAMHKVAEILNMPRMRVYEFATFYSMYKRHYKGKFHIKVCSTTPCMIMGSDLILQMVEQTTCCSVGHVSRDGLFGVEIVQCQGACANAPVVAINDDYYEDLTVCDIYNIIETLKTGGIPRAGPHIKADDLVSPSLLSRNFSQFRKVIAEGVSFVIDRGKWFVTPEQREYVTTTTLPATSFALKTSEKCPEYLHN